MRHGKLEHITEKTKRRKEVTVLQHRFQALKKSGLLKWVVYHARAAQRKEGSALVLWDVSRSVRRTLA